MAEKKPDPCVSNGAGTGERGVSQGSLVLNRLNPCIWNGAVEKHAPLHDHRVCSVTYAVVMLLERYGCDHHHPRSCPGNPDGRYLRSDVLGIDLNFWGALDYQRRTGHSGRPGRVSQLRTGAIPAH